MGVYSYLSETTPEEDRTFRFSVFAQFVQIVSIVSLPFAGPLFQTFGYISEYNQGHKCNINDLKLMQMFNHLITDLYYFIFLELLLICIPINIFGILYLIFVLKEPAHKNETIERSSGVDNPAFASEVNGQREQVHSEHTNETKTNKATTNATVSKTMAESLRAFFNPIVAVQCLAVITRKRKNWGRALICLVLSMYFIAMGPAFGEDPNSYNFTRIQLNWDGTTYSTFATYGTFVSLIGTIVMTTVLSKMLRFSDPILGFIGTSLSCGSKVFYVSWIRDQISSTIF